MFGTTNVAIPTNTTKKMATKLSLAKLSKPQADQRRKSTILRHDLVHAAHCEVNAELGDFAHLVPKSYIYDRIHERTGLCTKTIAYILNHTQGKARVC